MKMFNPGFKTIGLMTLIMMVGGVLFLFTGIGQVPLFLWFGVFAFVISTMIVVSNKIDAADLKFSTDIYAVIPLVLFSMLQDVVLPWSVDLIGVADDLIGRFTTGSLYTAIIMLTLIGISIMVQGGLTEIRSVAAKGSQSQGYGKSETTSLDNFMAVIYGLVIVALARVIPYAIFTMLGVSVDIS